MQFNAALFRELDGIANQVHQSLTQPRGVAPNPVGERVGEPARQLQSLPPGFLDKQTTDSASRVYGIKVDLFESHLSGLDFGKIQNVVQKGEQRFGRARHVLQIFLLLLTVWRVHRQGSHPQDGVHRCADLMTHVGQKLTLQFCGFPGAGQGGGQLSVLLTHRRMRPPDSDRLP